MVPTAFVVLDTLPVTPNGKIDRQNLPAPDHARLRILESFVAPRTPIEELLADMWASVLGVTSVGIHDNFFALGGHSLLALQVLSRLRKTFHVQVTLHALFDAPTVAGLARCLEMICQAPQGAPVPPLRAMSQERRNPADHDSGTSLGPRSAAAWCTLFECALCGANERTP